MGTSAASRLRLETKTVGIQVRVTIETNTGMGIRHTMEDRINITTAHISSTTATADIRTAAGRDATAMDSRNGLTMVVVAVAAAALIKLRTTIIVGRRVVQATTRTIEGDCH